MWRNASTHGGRDIQLILQSSTSMWRLQAGNLLFWLSLYFYVPILPVYAAARGASLALVGVMLSAYGVMQFLLRIPTGIASDLAGRRRPFVLAGLAASALGALAFALAPGPWFLVAARATTGVAACAWVVITVLFASYYEPREAPKAIGLLGFTNGLGQAGATYVGGVVAEHWGWSAPFYLAAAAAALGAALVALAPEGRARGGDAGARRAAPPVRWAELWRLATERQLLLVSSLAAINTYATFTTVFGFTPVLAQSLGASRADLGLLTALTVAPFTLTQLFAARIAGVLGFPRTVLLSMLLSGALTLATPLAASVAALTALQIGASVGRGLLSTTLMSLSILAVDPRRRATAMGVYQALYAIGMFLGPFTGGFLADAAGLPAVFAMTGGLVMAAGLVGWRALGASDRQPTRRSAQTLS